MKGRWDHVPLKRVITAMTRGTAPNYVDDGPVRVIGQAANQTSGINWTRTRFHASDVGVSRLKGLLIPGDILVNSTGTGTLGRVGQYVGGPDGRPCIADGHITVVRANTEFAHPRFLYYTLSSQPFYDRIYAEMVVGATNQIELSTEKLSRAPIPLPPLEEQRRIADFLDAEVTRLDTLAQFRLRQESLLTERLFARAAILTRRSDAVRQGAAYRGVPLRRALISIRTGLTPTTLRDKSQSTDSDIPWYTPAAVDDLMSIGDADKVIDQGSRGVPTFPKDSILVVGIGESLGKVGYLDHAATGNQQLTALHTVPEVDSRFLAWQLWAVRDELRSWSQYSRVRIINNGSLSSFPIHLPPKSRQITIRIELDNEREHVLAFRQVAAAFAQRLVERKQALITAAVTGQFDVTTARGVDVS